jgi:OOP family OmpA-OmpF porin
MSKRNILSRGLLAVILGAAAFGAQAAEPSGFYLGAGAGQAMIDDGALDDEDTAFSAFAGYDFNRYFGLEAGYADLGKTEPLGSAGPELEADAAYLVAVGTVPFTERFSGYAKAGYSDWSVDTSIPGLDDDGNDPTYGLGVQYRFTDSVALRGEYNRFEVEDSEIDLAQVQVRFDF